MNDPSFLMRLIKWCKEERARLREEEDKLRRREIQIKQVKLGSPDIDITEQSLERVKHDIRELDALIAFHSRGAGK